MEELMLGLQGISRRQRQFPPFLWQIYVLFVW
jgi:hypothetical protein